jgi:hypothetical protein
MVVSLRLFYLIVCHLLRWLTPLGRTTSPKEIELLVLRHVSGSRTRPWCLTSGFKLQPRTR